MGQPVDCGPSGSQAPRDAGRDAVRLVCDLTSLKVITTKDEV